MIKRIIREVGREERLSQSAKEKEKKKDNEQGVRNRCCLSQLSSDPNPLPQEPNLPLLPVGVTMKSTILLLSVTKLSEGQSFPKSVSSHTTTSINF